MRSPKIKKIFDFFLLFFFEYANSFISHYKSILIFSLDCDSKNGQRFFRLSLFNSSRLKYFRFLNIIHFRREFAGILSIFLPTPKSKLNFDYFNLNRDRSPMHTFYSKLEQIRSRQNNNCFINVQLGDTKLIRYHIIS